MLGSMICLLRPPEGGTELPIKAAAPVPKSTCGKLIVAPLLRLELIKIFFNCLQVGGGDVCYASLDLPSGGQKRLKKKRAESSDFSTYSEIKTDKM